MGRLSSACQALACRRCRGAKGTVWLLNAPGDAGPVSTVEYVTRAGTPEGDRIFRNRRVLYGATTLVLTLLLGLAVLDALSGIDV